MLSGLQQDIARLLAGLPEAEGFALAGGGALIALGIVDRHTGDLDFFGRESAAVDRLGPAFEAAAAAAGLSVTRLREAPGFVRLEVARGDERSEVDLGYDARLWPVRQTPLGPAIADNELAADKTLALFGRAAARDYLDVHALTRRYPEDQLIAFAALKDRGFSPAHLGDALAAIDRLGREQFEIDDEGYDELRRWALGWSRLLLDQSREIGSRDPPERSGPDIGL